MGLGVGYVISGMYFGWNLGLEQGGTLGLPSLLFSSLSCMLLLLSVMLNLLVRYRKPAAHLIMLPVLLGKDIGFIAGMAQNIEFIFAPPAIAFAIGAYFNLFFPQIPLLAIAIFGYIVFTALNIYGVKAAAMFELAITILAVGELLLFAGITLPHFEYKKFATECSSAWMAGSVCIYSFCHLVFPGY